MSPSPPSLVSHPPLQPARLHVAHQTRHLRALGRLGEQAAAREEGGGVVVAGRGVGGGEGERGGGGGGGGAGVVVVRVCGGRGGGHVEGLGVVVV